MPKLGVNVGLASIPRRISRPPEPVRVERTVRFVVVRGPRPGCELGPDKCAYSHTPIQTKGGYSLFKVVERYDEVYHDLDNERVRSSVTRDVREKKERHHFNDQLQAFRDKFADRITVFEEHLEHYTAASPPAEQ